MNAVRKGRSGTIPGLTGLRGVAAIWVVAFHLTLNMGVPVLDLGYLGVDVFFILSGFVLAYVYAGKLRPGDLGGYLRFIRARVARIYPLHVFMLCLVAIAVLTLPGFADSYPMSDRRFSADAFVASLLLIQNWAHWLPASWNTPSWSLSAEWFAYLTFPLFLLFTQHWKSAAVSLLLATGSLLAFFAVMTLKGLHNPGEMGMPGMVRMACEFACGCLLFRATANGLRPLPRVADLAAVGLLLFSLIYGRAIFLSLPAFALIVLLAAQNRGWVARGLSIPSIVFLGEISYSIYMVHWLVLQLSNRLAEAAKLNHVQMLFWHAGVVAAILGLSVLTNRLIERPARAWGRTLAANSVRPLANVDHA